MKLLRPLAVTAAALLAVLVLAITVLGEKLNSEVAEAIGRTLGGLTGCAVRVGTVDISLRNGEGTISGIVVENPAAFARGDMLSLDGISLKVDGATVAEETVVVGEIRIRETVVRQAVDASGRSNTAVLVETLPERASDAQEGKAISMAPRFLVEAVIVEGGRTEHKTGGEGPSKADIPAFTLEDIGGPGGTSAADVGREVLLAVGKAAKDAFSP